MTHKQIIASGLLESYAAGLCTADEKLLVEKALQESQEVRQELEAIEIAVEIIAMQNARKPKANLRASVLEAIENIPQEKIVEPSSTRVSEPQLKTESPAKSIAVSFRWKPLAAAASLLLVASVSYNIYQASELNNAKQILASYESEKSQMADELNTVKASYNQLADNINILKSSELKVVDMPGVAGKESLKARVLWNPSSEEVFLSVQNLPELDENSVYQLWAIVDGKPVDAGILTETGPMVKMKNFAKADAFAITIEKSGGAESPNLEQLCVLGNVNS